jgi:serine protease DegQ
MEAIIQHGSVTRGWIGVEPQEITPELAESFGLAQKMGSLVAGVLRNGPADKGGMRPGDILLKIDGKAVADTTEMLNLIAQLRPGDKVRFVVLRKNQETALDLVVGKRPKRNEPVDEPQ